MYNFCVPPSSFLCESRTSLLVPLVAAPTYAFSNAIIFFAYIITFRFGAFLVTLDEDHVLYAEYQDIYRVFAAVIFGALAIGAAGSFAPDFVKAKLAAKRVFVLLDRPSLIDSYSEEGSRPVRHSIHVYRSNCGLTSG